MLENIFIQQLQNYINDVEKNPQDNSSMRSYINFMNRNGEALKNHQDYHMLLTYKAAYELSLADSNPVQFAAPPTNKYDIAEQQITFFVGQMSSICQEIIAKNTELATIQQKIQEIIEQAHAIAPGDAALRNDILNQLALADIESSKDAILQNLQTSLEMVNIIKEQLTHIQTKLELTLSENAPKQLAHVKELIDSIDKLLEVHKDKLPSTTDANMHATIAEFEFISSQLEQTGPAKKRKLKIDETCFDLTDEENNEKNKLARKTGAKRKNPQTSNWQEETLSSLISQIEGYQKKLTDGSISQTTQRDLTTGFYEIFVEKLLKNTEYQKFELTQVTQAYIDKAYSKYEKGELLTVLERLALIHKRHEKIYNTELCLATLQEIGLTEINASDHLTATKQTINASCSATPYTTSSKQIITSLLNTTTAPWIEKNSKPELNTIFENERDKFVSFFNNSNEFEEMANKTTEENNNHYAYTPNL
jgi:hypothetical protein